MLTFSRYTGLWALLLFVNSTLAQEKYSKVKLFLRNDAQRQWAFDHLELDHFTQERKSITAILDQDEVQLVRRSGISFQIEIDDVVQHTLELNKKLTPADVMGNGNSQRLAFQQTGKTVSSIITTPAAFTPGSLTLGANIGQGYYTYAEMITKMQDLAINYPGIVSLFSIGTSHEGRTIYCVKISDNVAVDEAEPEVLYTALQHAREAISGTSMIFFMQYLAENYATNADIRALVNNRELFIVPCVNPDGYVFNYTGANSPLGGGMWRKNRRNNGNGTFGVDLNRNYGTDWGNCAGATSSCGSSTPSSDTYWGPSAFSEPETRAIRDLVYARQFVAAIDQHCYGPYFSLPFGRPSLHTMNASDANFYTYVPAAMGLYNCHRAGNSPETVNYEVAGGLKDWWILGDIGVGSKGKIYGMTGEAGGGAFWAPVSQIPQLCKELCFQNLQLAYAAGSYYDLQDMSDVAISSAMGSLSCRIKRVGLGNDPVTVTLIPIENISSLGNSFTTTINNYYDEAVATLNYIIPTGTPHGSRVRFGWRVESGGISITDTITKYYNPVVLLYDGMEGSLTTNWSVPNGGGPSEKWGFTSSAAYAGNASLAESPTGNYGTNNTRIITYKNTLNLSDATAAHLSFWVRHRAENCRDKLQVQVSTNGSTWIPLHGKNTVAEPNTTNGGTLGSQPALTGIRPNWTRELYDLSAYNGVSNLQLRFVFTSDGDGGTFAYEVDDGFYIDELKIVKATSSFTTLPVNFTHFSGKLLANNTVLLQWEAITDHEHDFFELERSIDGRNFISLGIIKGNPPYHFTDAQPFVGKNYYRIKQVEKNRSVSYSKIIEIDNRIAATALHVYPNPAQQQLYVQFNSKSTEQYQLQILDTQGRLIMEQRVQGNIGLTQMILPVHTLSPQLYLLQIRNREQQLIATERFLKQ